MRLDYLIKNELNQYKKDDDDPYLKEKEDKIREYISSHGDIDYLDLEQWSRYKLLRAYHQFWYSPNEEDFQEVLNGLFFMYSSCWLALLNGEIGKSYISSIGKSSLFLGVLTFFPQKEIKNMYHFLTLVLDKDLSRNYDIKYQSTILQEAFILFNQNVSRHSSIFDKYVEEPLHPTYERFLVDLYTDDNELFNSNVEQMCDFHLQRSDISSHSNEFFLPEWQLIPTEIFAGLRSRYLKGKSIEKVSNELVVKFIPYLSKEKFLLTGLAQQLSDALSSKIISF
jgi:hypothetical protein